MESVPEIPETDDVGSLSAPLNTAEPYLVDSKDLTAIKERYTPEKLIPEYITPKKTTPKSLSPEMFTPRKTAPPDGFKMGSSSTEEPIQELIQTPAKEFTEDAPEQTTDDTTMPDADSTERPVEYLAEGRPEDTPMTESNPTDPVSKVSPDGHLTSEPSKERSPSLEEKSKNLTIETNSSTTTSPFTETDDLQSSPSKDVGTQETLGTPPEDGQSTRSKRKRINLADIGPVWDVEPPYKAATEAEKNDWIGFCEIESEPVCVLWTIKTLANLA
jgi:hypothetical protein